MTATDLRAAQLGHVFQQWNDELSSLGGVSALVDIASLGNTVLDLTLAHPSGIAQLYAGRTTALHSLIRDKADYAAAVDHATAVKRKADLHAAKYGLPPTHLGLGIAFWTERDPLTGKKAARRVPVMLRPVALVDGKHGIELELEHTLVINPVLSELLVSHGIPLDPEAMARDAITGTSFNPSPVLNTLAAMGQAVFGDFRVKNKLIVGVFEHPGTVLADDLKHSKAIMMRHPVLAGLAGDLEARAALGSQQIPELVPFDRPPDHERGVGDLNTSQFHVVDAAAAGLSVLVDAPAGAPVAATLAAVIADAVGSGRSVLYVSSETGSKRSVIKALRAFGLGECLQDLEPSHDWRQKALAHLVAGLRTEAPAVDVEGITQIRSALAERSGQISAYLTALHKPLPTWEVSPYQALQSLGQIAQESPLTRNNCRLERDAVIGLVGERREEAREALRRSAQIGLFKLTEDVTAWLPADVPDETAAADLLARLDRLREQTLSRTIAHMRDVTSRTGLSESTTVAGWGDQLEMLRGVREALDQFIPEIFERSPEDMVAATATNEWRTEHGQEMSGRTRRRLKRQARDLVRPGLQVDDLHTALEKVRVQREIWLGWSPTVPWPKLPTGMPQIEAEFQAAASDLAALGLALRGDSKALGELPFTELFELLERLHSDRDSLDFLPELARMRRSLEGFGLAPLLEDLRTRSAGPDLGATGPEAEAAIEAVVREVDFAWWSSVLAYALQDRPELAATGGDALGALIESFRELDIAHTATKPIPIRAGAHAWRQRAAEAYPAQAFKLSHLENGASLRSALADNPDVGLLARPCVIAGTVMVPQALPLHEVGGPPFDLVIVDGASTLTPAEAAAAIARGKQVVVVGDSARTAGGSLVSGIGEFLPHVPLPAEVNERDPRVTELLEGQGYTTLGPGLPQRERTPRITWTHVDANGLVAGGATRIDASTEEVEAAVSLIEIHLRRWPDESLAVMTATPEHANRVRAAAQHAAKHGNQVLARALAGEGPEPLLVTDAAGGIGITRDAVIFAPGLAKSPRGAVMYEFGQLTSDEGAYALTDVLLAGRRRLTVVSSLRAEELDESRLRGEGPKLFRAVLMAASHPKAISHSTPDPLDPLLADLAG
ncbi:MAG: hypothetical protein LBH68_06480, partial [Bifidobacteriaceae bacterium]|nr:hypothetical protein [Bifidobacteriaceae bacterium]